MAFSGQNLVSDVSLREIPTLNVPQGGTRSFTLTARDRTTGHPLVIPDNAVVKFASMYLWGHDELIFKVEGTVVDADAGTISVTLTGENTDIAGSFTASLAIFINDELIHAQPYYVHIEPVDLYASNGPPTIAEIRLHLRDTSPENNFLLDETEFSDTEIAACVRLPVDQFNELPPDIGRYTVHTFPFRYHWLQATVGHLLRIAAAHHRRNRLQYASGGMTVDPHADKSREYETIATARLQEYLGWASAKKVEINISGGYGIISSPYANRYTSM